ncbi:hypothetical protein GUITHDRAFT_156065 [Guillardia theta CCMP2712]|uniref:Uncharacterized protein n=1 Tax=Guillardia theta (strain CCMP2712) TaxID=905079 RepID=L1IBY6_GUITC|nr:hypothetical protein GUITHDRAFT_156065 [Guillardia theta CCMP2712]EKX33340.1 hypothetical protein GUITHDRAFT_156065 [Guillardia theta CCMP2712]|eukprot:XP_005820320.1 hypothetical protein GUITHDRAFT_156065 [Guillardia theta CCMP2712]
MFNNVLSPVNALLVKLSGSRLRAPGEKQFLFPWSGVDQCSRKKRIVVSSFF